MKKLYIILIAVILVFLIASILVLPNLFPRSAYTQESDFWWIRDTIEQYVKDEFQLPINWEELLTYSKRKKTNQPIPNIQNRVEINFNLFSQLNDNGWQLSDNHKSNQWGFRWKMNKSEIHQDFLRECCNILQHNIPVQYQTDGSKRAVETGAKMQDENAETGGKMSGNSDEPK